MKDILIRNVPEKMQRELKKRAKRHHRSMIKEIYAILEENLNEVQSVNECPTPYKGAFKITNHFIDAAKRHSRQ